PVWGNTTSSRLPRRVPATGSVKRPSPGRRATSKTRRKWYSCTAPRRGLGDASADRTADLPALFLLGAYHQDGAPSLSVCRNSSAEQLEASVMREADGRRPGAHRRSVFTIGQPQVND